MTDAAPKDRPATLKIFIPVNDSMPDTPDFGETLIPYQPGMVTIGQAAACGHDCRQSRSNTNSSPGLTPSSLALPALSSSTYLAGPALE